MTNEQIKQFCDNLTDQLLGTDLDWLEELEKRGLVSLLDLEHD